jgi:hypothetical protein
MVIRTHNLAELAAPHTVPVLPALFKGGLF